MSITLKETIQKDIVKAMKAKDELTKTTLRVLMSDIQRAQIDSDSEIENEINKAVKRLKDNSTETSADEIVILEKYLPKQLTDSQIEGIVVEIIEANSYSEMKHMKPIMGYFAENYPNQYDGKVLSTIVKTQLRK